MQEGRLGENWKRRFDGPVRDGRDVPAWHALEAGEVLERLESREEGLSGAAAACRLAVHGPNSLLIVPPASAWKILIGQVKSLIVLLLLAAAGVALIIGDVLEAIAIGAVLVLNVVVGFWVEWRARQAMESLRRLQVQEAVVIREGEERRVDASELVPGDVILLEAGQAIPADARLLTATELRTTEAPLTGESLPASKSVEPDRPSQGDDPDEVPIADRRSMVYKGTLVAAGSGRAVVVGTGRETEIGRVSELVQETEAADTPLERRLDQLARRLVWITLGIGCVVVGVGWIRGAEIWLMVETGIALAIAAVPEGLPVVATITLAVGVRRMARRQALVRRLPAVETLGSATVICTDKTGTLTAGEMTVTHVWVADRLIEVTGRGYRAEGEFRAAGDPIAPLELRPLELALRVAVLANRARVEGSADACEVIGDPTEAALLVAGRKAGLERKWLLSRYPEVADVPFSSERMLMATFHTDPDGGTRACVKGAPGRLIQLSGSYMVDRETMELDGSARAKLTATNRELAAEGLRVLAVATRRLEDGETPDQRALRDLTFVGLIGMIDPPAEGVKETISRFREAGVRTVMITGDQAVTAEAVARVLGVLEPGEELLEAGAMARLSEDELSERIGRIGAFARVSPEHKLRIVRAFQRRGEIVAMLGDGVNDAPALKQADIGVAMGRRGTDVAKETAGLVLADDRFETIGRAVEEGRVIFDNIRKFIFYLFSCNLSEVLVVFTATLSGLPLPLMPLQILWLNLITDVFPALALATEPPEADVMRRPPRDPAAAILSRSFVITVAGYGTLLTISTIGVFAWALEIRRVPVEYAVTLAFMTLALTQLLHVFNARSPNPVVTTGRLLTNRWVWGAVALTVVLQLLAVYAPGLSRVLRTVPLTAMDWAVVFAVALLPLMVGEGWKRFRAGRTSGRESSDAHP